MPANIPEGFRPFAFNFGFIENAGPLYGKWDGTNMLMGFRVEMRHCNPGRVAHGGMLATFADMLLPMASRFQSKIDMGFMPTINLTCDYLSPAKLGAWVEGRAEPVGSPRALSSRKAWRQPTASRVCAPMACLSAWRPRELAFRWRICFWLERCFCRQTCIKPAHRFRSGSGRACSCEDG